MKQSCLSMLFIGLSAMLSASGSQAAAYNVDPGASVVKLRTSCTEGAAPQVTLNNCFDSSADLNSWISATRQPVAASPLLVEVGAGAFGALSLSCSGWGHTTFIGAGRGNTTFSGSSFSGCTEMEFKHMTFDGGITSAGVRWSGQSSTLRSRWEDVELIGRLYGWYEIGGGSTCSDAIKGNAGQHYWLNSRIVGGKDGAVFVFAYRDACGSENWFFASELVAQAPSSSVYEVNALNQDGIGDTHFYGSVIRTLADVAIGQNAGVFCEISAPRELVSAVCASRGSVHIHGTGIDVISSVGNDVAALVVGAQASVHANETAYNLQPGSGGNVRRIRDNGGTIKAPYLWEQQTTPPDIDSIDGADMAVVTTPGGTPSFVIYSDNCASKWYDVGAGACRP